MLRVAGMLTAAETPATHRNPMGTADTNALRRAETLLRQGHAPEAAALLEAALGGGKQDPVTTRLLVTALAASNDLIAALDRQKTLVPANIVCCDTQGRDDSLAAARLAQLAMFYEDAAQIARQLVERDPADVEAAHLLATLALWLDGPEAARAALAGVAVQDFPPHLLSEILAFHHDPPSQLLDRTLALAADAGLSSQARAELLLALAQHYDRAGDPDAAWQLAQRGNALTPPRPPQDWRGVLDAHLRIYQQTPSVPEATGQRHLYLLGTPRSGQSLLQSLLGASGEVASAGERGALLQHLLLRTGEIARMSAFNRASLYAELAAADQRGLARLFGQAELIVDKSPFHLPVAGSIARIHSGALFAAVLRDPVDTALSIWLRNFPPIYDYANDLGAVFNYLEFAFDALQRWRDAGVTIRLIDHASIISEPAREGSALFDWLGLTWRDEYLKPENRTQPVPTFSAAQVRKPISTDVARRMAAYEPRLEAFADVIEKLRQRQTALLAGRL